MKTYFDQKLSNSALMGAASPQSRVTTASSRKARFTFCITHLFSAVLLLALAAIPSFGTSSTFFGTGAAGPGADPNYTVVSSPLGRHRSRLTQSLPMEAGLRLHPDRRGSTRMEL